jgi:pyruvate dehydrogenase E2 component (dihydrolipoamide acetyltransferase)
VLQAIDYQDRRKSDFIGVGIEGKQVNVAVTGMRRSIAQRTYLSKSEIPHYYASVTIDMSEAKSFLAETKAYAERKGWSAPTITDLSIQAAALALNQSPQINASFQGEEIIYFDDIHIGLVIGLTEGILVPVIHHANRKSLYTLAAITTRLKEKIKTGTISNQDLIGSTFTISNLGMFRLDSFTAVINPPEAGILALGAVKQMPAVWNGQIVPRWLMTAVLSVDHRVVDGIVAARFLDEFRQLLEHPVVLTLATPEDISE